MDSYEIPKEIKSKPKLMGLEMKELVILLIGFFSIFTVFKDMVHGVLVIPFMFVAVGLLFWLVMPSRNNPMLRNYMSLFLFFKRDKYSYHALDVNQYRNEKVIQEVENARGEQNVAE